ncbi:hypothetical protein SAMN05421819_2710 [Bryocella elongata]|uniref:Uncharacterized protein n=1 Tax=Bryocella elongata TaxID=863522 RepID=A0A1H5ZM16_9BACT|nr:hypothetical protein SAMN05421819_2710 [Bryocella elongata]
MRRNYSDCERVLQLRLEAAGGVAELLTREQELLEELERPSRAQQSTSRTARILAVMLRIEIARLGRDGEGFTYMSGELEQASYRISQGVDVLQEMIRARHASTPARKLRVDESRAQARKNLALIESGRELALDRADRALNDFERLPLSLDECVQEASTNIARVTSAVQMQDLTRQQTEHVEAVLQAVMGAPGSSNLHPTHVAAVLRVQLEQMENIRRTTSNWFEEIEQCVSSILRLGDTELLAIMEQIVCLQNSIEEQGLWVAKFEGEFEQHDRVNEEELSEFESMMSMVRGHLDQSQKTSEHLQLLNLNSMVAAHNVGSQAASVLQITNSISRLATDWRGLTLRSVQSMEHMITAATSRGDRAREASDSTRTAIAAMQQESKSTLDALRSVSELGVRCQHEGQQSVLQMQGRVNQVNQSMRELRNVLDGIVAASEDIAHAVKLSESRHPLQLPESDRREIEAYCEGSYTSEIERHVMRAVLFGEDIPPPVPSANEGAIELF